MLVKEISISSFKKIGAETIKVMISTQIERQALEFLALRKIAIENKDKIPQSLLEVIDSVVKAPSEVNSIIFKLPHIKQWCLILKEFLLFNLDAEGVRGRMELHGCELRRLLLSAFMQVQPNKIHSGELVVHSSGSIHLPGTNWMGLYPKNMCGKKVFIQGRYGECPFEKGLNTKVGLAELWTTDRLITRAVYKDYEFPPETTENIEQWNQLLKDYTKELERYWPEFYQEIPLLLQGIVYVEAKSLETHLSGTFAEVPGTIYLSWSNSLDIIKEAITHELFHTRLNLFISNESFDSYLFTKDIFWSPWRFTIRPTIAFIHGTYAHYGMAFHNDLVARQVSTKHWRSKLATYLIRLAIAEVQWTEALNLYIFPAMLKEIMSIIFQHLKEVWDKNKLELREEILVAAIGEKSELLKHETHKNLPIFNKNIHTKLANILEEVARG